MMSHVGVIGNGIEIRPSSIPSMTAARSKHSSPVQHPVTLDLLLACLLHADAGMGLFTSRHYAKNELVTEYCGELISHSQARKLREEGKDTHVRALNSFHLCIDGIKVPQQGLGGASFANDARDLTKNNVVFVTRYMMQCMKFCMLSAAVSGHLLCDSMDRPTTFIHVCCMCCLSCTGMTASRGVTGCS